MAVVVSTDESEEPVPWATIVATSESPWVAVLGTVTVTTTCLLIPLPSDTLPGLTAVGQL